MIVLRKLKNVFIGFFPEELPHSYFIWELEPSHYHVIEGVRAVKGLDEASPLTEAQQQDA